MKLKPDGHFVFAELDDRVKYQEVQMAQLMKSFDVLCPNDLRSFDTVLKLTEHLRLYNRCILDIQRSEVSKK